VSRVLCVNAAAGILPATAQTGTYSDTVEVREAEILVGMPADFRPREARRLRPRGSS